MIKKRILFLIIILLLVDGPLFRTRDGFIVFLPINMVRSTLLDGSASADPTCRVPA